MLDRARNDVLESRTTVPTSERSQQLLCDAKNGVVIRLRAPTGENDFLRPCADQRRDLLARGFNASPSSLSEGVNRGSVPKFPRKKGEHGVEHIRLDSRSGIVVQIDAIHGPAIRIDSTSPNGKQPYQMLSLSKRAERCVHDERQGSPEE